MITFCKDYLKNLITGISIDGITIKSKYVYLKSEDKLRPKVSFFASILSLKDDLKKERKKFDKRFFDDSGTKKLQFKKSKYLRNLTLVLTVAAHSEDWIDKLFTEILKTIDHRVTNGEDIIEITVKEISWQDDVSILNKTDVSIMIIEFSQNITTWEDQPHFTNVTPITGDTGGTIPNLKED